MSSARMAGERNEKEVKICPLCTFHNETSSVACLVCDSPLDNNRRRAPTDAGGAMFRSGQPATTRDPPQAQAERGAGYIECPHCTFHNSEDLRVCEACSGTLKRKRNNPISTAPENQEIFVLEEEEQEEELSQPSAHICVTSGLVPLIRRVLEEERENQSISIDYRLCSSVCPHVSQKNVAVGGDWSCGYRNIQMICHTLMALPSYRRALFNGNGEVPDVQGIQAWIEKAWAAGFDQEGRWQLGGSLLGTCTWIGATECAALLRFMKIRCQIVDFVGLKPKSSSSSATTKRNTKSRNGAVPEQLLSPADMTVLHPLIQWTQIYFQSGSPPTAWDEAYESEANSSGLPHDEPEFIPPVYFQQDGHSRTLIGYEYRGNGKCSLFIFDPNHHGTTFKAKLEERKGWQMMLKRGGHTLKRSEYQIVQILPGLMDEQSQEYEDSKIMTSATFP